MGMNSEGKSQHCKNSSKHSENRFPSSASVVRFMTSTLPPRRQLSWFPVPWPKALTDSPPPWLECPSIFKSECSSFFSIKLHVQASSMFSMNVQAYSKFSWNVKISLDPNVQASSTSSMNVQAYLKFSWNVQTSSKLCQMS